ncbi:SpaH/EbpB family LPXTG-anchored major pilin [Corynebacterium sp. ES2715-CONJ3]|uniref:SpaH/EbpB family LPXTG-anchored major pilin n=1 Tax=Corynebacterium sp. ES2715-CONJ3 TaxID=2974028 RepID=UPI0021672FFB|nr:SpaH/EbpB family LPXTG-anchored major pilin [Corynebacterium sp. ES2715-CONJ3]MCS4491311.1 SpaH/EbpB family LPXTG-anchored major pilin [Corynebacterium sp. ES2715-CONJ3]
MLQKTKRHQGRRLFAALATVACMTVTTPLAVAADGGPSPSLIDASQKASLSIHKSEGDPVMQYGDPSNPNAPKKLDPLEGIKFSVQKINGVDLTTNDGWRLAESFKIADFYQRGKEFSRLAPKVSEATGADGIARFNNLDLGLYYVTEEVDSAARGNFTVVSPFIVAVPTTSKDRSGWDYSVTVNAKDQKITGRSSNNLSCVNPGDDLQYGVSTTLPAPERDGRISTFKVSVPLEQSQTYIPDSEEVYYGTYHNDKNPVRLEGGDYTIDADSGNVVRVTLTDSGLAKVSEVRFGNPDAHLTVLFKAKTSRDASKNKDRISFRGYITPPGYPDFDLIGRYGVATDEASVKVPCSSPNIPIVPIPIPIPPIDPPGNPPIPKDPPSPDEPPRPNDPKKGIPKIPGNLAYTGANSLPIAIFGLVLLLVGIAVLRRSYKRN